MEVHKPTRTGTRRKTQVNKPNKRTTKTKRAQEEVSGSDKKNYSSRNINRYTKNVLEQIQKRPSNMKYSDYDKNKKGKSGGRLFRGLKQRKLGEGVQERVSAQTEVGGVSDRRQKRKKKRVKVNRMQTYDLERTSIQVVEKSTDWGIDYKAKDLDKELSMSENQSQKDETVMPLKKGVKAHTPNSNTRKRPKFSLANKNKSQSKMGRQVKTKRNSKIIPKYNPYGVGTKKSKQEKQKDKKPFLISKDIKGARDRIETMPVRQMLESDGFKGSAKKNFILKSTRNVPKWGYNYAVNSMNNIPLANELTSDKPSMSKMTPKLDSKKSKSKSITSKISGLRFNIKKPNHSKLTKMYSKLNQTYTYEPHKRSGVSLGYSKVSSTTQNPRGMRKSKIPPFKPDVIPSPLSTQNKKNKPFNYLKKREISGNLTSNRKIPKNKISVDFQGTGSYLAQNQDTGDHKRMFKKNEYYAMNPGMDERVINYPNNPHPMEEMNDTEQDLYMPQNFKYKMYSNKNLQKQAKPPMMQMGMPHKPWPGQRSSHSGMYEFIRIPIQQINNYPVQENQLYFQKSKTSGSGRPQVRSQVSSFSEFPVSPQHFERFIARPVNTKQYMDPNMSQSGQNYFKREFNGRDYERVMINPEMFPMGEYVPRQMGMMSDNQKYVMVRNESEGLVLMPARDLHEKSLGNPHIPNPSRLVKSQFPEGQIDPNFHKEPGIQNFLMTDNSLNAKIKDFNSSIKSRENFRNKKKIYKEDRKKLKKIRNRVNKEGGERRFIQELHGIMSLIKTADRATTMIQKLLKLIKNCELQGAPIPESKTIRLSKEIGEFHRIISTLELQTTQIGLVDSSMSYIRQSEYENSLDTSTQIDSMVPPSNEYPISIENSERNQVSTLCSEILSRESSINTDKDKNGPDQIKNKKNKIKMRKKMHGEKFKIDSKGRRNNQNSGSHLEHLPMSKFEEGMTSPKSKIKKKKSKLYKKNRGSRDIQLIEKPNQEQKKKLRNNKVHKKQFSQNLPRPEQSKNVSPHIIATPKTIAYNKHSEKSSVDIKMQTSLNQIPSDLNNFELSGSIPRQKNNFFMQYSKENQVFEQRLQEDKELLRKREGFKPKMNIEVETQSEKGNIRAKGLVNQIKEELNSERGTQFKQLLLQVMNGYKIPRDRMDSGVSPLGRKIFNYNQINQSNDDTPTSKEINDNIYKKKPTAHEIEEKHQPNLYQLISSNNSNNFQKNSSSMQVSDLNSQHKNKTVWPTKGLNLEYDNISGVKTNDENQVHVQNERLVKSCKAKDQIKTNLFTKPSKFIMKPKEKREKQKDLPVQQISNKRKTFQNRRNLKIFNSSKNNSIVRRQEEEEELPKSRDFHTDETAKILKGMYFKKIESSGSEKSIKKKTGPSKDKRTSNEHEKLHDSPEKKIKQMKQKSSEEDLDEELFTCKKTNPSFENAIRSSQELFFDKKLISDRDMIQNSIQSITKHFNRNSKEKNGEDSIFPFSKKQIESNKKLLSEGSQNHIRQSLNQTDTEFDGLFGQKTKDNLSLSIEPSDRLINKNSFRGMGTRGINLGSELDNSNVNSLAFQSNAHISHPFGITREMQLTKEKKMNGGNGDKSGLNFELSSKFSINNSNFDFRMNEREINLDWMNKNNKLGSHRMDSKEVSSKQIWNESFKESNRGMTREFMKASNEFLFDEEPDESPPKKNPREIPKLEMMTSFKDMTKKDSKDVFESQNIEFSRARNSFLDESSGSIKKKKSITTVKNYNNLPSSKVYSSPDPKHKMDSNKISTFKEMPGILKIKEEENEQFEKIKKELMDKMESQKQNYVKEIEDQRNFIAELKTKNSNLNTLLEQNKQKVMEKERNLKKNVKETAKKSKLFSKMKIILTDFKGRLTESLKNQQISLQNTPESMSFIEQQNRQFVNKAFNYEKILMQKIKDVNHLQIKEKKMKKMMEEKINDNINLEDKIQVHKNRTQNQENSISKLEDKIRNYERIVENLEHELANKEMKLAAKTRKYRKEIARAKKCGKCSQRSLRKIQGKNSEILLNDLNQIKEESLSNYSEMDSDHQEVNLNDYQEVLDSKNKIQGKYNELMAKYLDCRNKKNKYQLRYQMLSDKNSKYRKILKEVSKKSQN